MNSDDELIPCFIPALVVLLVNAEDQKDEPLTKEEVIQIRDRADCIMMTIADARKMAESREYPDIDPENCWHDWQMARREMGRLPDIDPGPRFDFVRSNDPAYQQAIHDAQRTIEQFREMLPVDGTPRADALIKVNIIDGENNAFMWLNNTARDGDSFTAELFEVPDTLPKSAVGVRQNVPAEELLDWMVNDEGQLHGGFSLRHHRAGLSDDEKQDFDEFIGVTEYLN